MKLDSVYNEILTKTQNGIVCPAHEDDHGSLSVNLADDKILLRCHAGCEFKNIVAALGMKPGDMFAGSQGKTRQRETARYRYEDMDGTHLFDVVRMEPPKTFRQQSANREWTTKDVKKVPYQLPQFLKAIKSGKQLLVVEGEKDALRAGKMGFIGTTFPGGAGKWRSEFAEYFRNADAVLVPDLDEPGIIGAHKIATGLNGTVKRLRWLQLPDMGDVKPKHGKDFFDWCNLPGSSTDELQRLIDNAPDWKPPKEPHSEEADSEPGNVIFEGGRFRISVNAVLYQPPPKVTKSGDVDQPEPIWICSRLNVEALTRNIGSEAWGRLLRWRDPDGKAHEWACPAAMLESVDGGELRRELAAQGLSISPNRKARELLMTYLKVSPVKLRARCVEKLGWHGSVYVTADESIGATDTEPVVFQSDSVLKPATECSGTLEDWKNTVANWARGNSRAVFSISSAAAGPLLSLSGGEPGGFHWRGPSSCGKTTLLHAAASFTGPPSNVVRSWRATANGLEGVAALHNDGTLLLDELSQISPDDAAVASYMLANGQAKQRASRTGSARRTLTWQVLFLSSGEESLSALMGRIRRRVNPGAEIRMLDVPADAGAGLGAFEELHEHPSGAALSLAFKDASSKYHGTVGRAWLRWVVGNRAALAEQLPELVKKFAKDYMPEDASGQVERAARRFALVAAAGELASGYGFTGWTEGEAERAAARCFRDWLNEYGGGPKEDRNILRQLKLFFEKHGSSRFEPMERSPDDNRVFNNRAGFWRIEGDDKEYLLLPNVFREEVCSGLDYQHAIKVLTDHEWIIPDNDGKHCQQNIRLPDLGQTRCYVFASKGWEEK